MTSTPKPDWLADVIFAARDNSMKMGVRHALDHVPLEYHSTELYKRLISEDPFIVGALDKTTMEDALQ